MFFWCRLLVLHISLFTLRSFAFEFKPVENITAFERTSFGWIWKHDDPPSIPIMLWNTDDTDGCPLLNDTNPDLGKLVTVNPQLNLSFAQVQENGDLHGIDWVTVGSSGSTPPSRVNLCAYSNETASKDGHTTFRVTLQNATSPILVIFDEDDYLRSLSKYDVPSDLAAQATVNALSGQQIAGIVLGVLAFLILLFLCARKRKGEQKSVEPSKLESEQTMGGDASTGNRTV
ncbi:hypothetical protein Moror_3686 [Moniliophthora roreri MCA 2997]|uniref:Uncharacterized protein n=2 Tax=Moniliophthora roreri TaxID=221103 RepID=V2WLV1_MONRO|nr:hypothetical protein Moror_3686 [Moniliophthora roreri MCA 2997]